MLFAAIVGLTAQQAALSNGAAHEVAPQVAPQAAPQAAPLVAPVAKPMSADDADAIILDRQLVMQQLDKDAKILGEIAAGIRPAKDLALYAKAVAKGAKESAKSFEVNVPGGASKPEIWTNWEDFSKRMAAFVENSEKMAKVSETGDVVQVTELFIGALPCKTCHDVYRTRK